MFNYEHEKQRWFANYLEFNDANINHAEFAFISNGYHINNQNTAEKLHMENVKFR